MSRIIIIAVFAAALWSAPALPCSLAPGFYPFELSSIRLPSSGPTPPAPVVSFHSLKRGFDDGDFASCSDAGILTLIVDDSKNPGKFGYIVELKSGSFPDDVLPDIIIFPRLISEGTLGFYFVWLDFLPGEESQPIEAEISVRAVSKTAVEGPEAVLKVRDR